MPIRGSPNGANALVHTIHTPDVIARNGWTPSIGTGGRHQSEQVDVFVQYAHQDACPIRLRPAWRRGNPRTPSQRRRPGPTQSSNDWQSFEGVEGRR